MANKHLKWRTCFSSISYFGYKLDILKSALQKYLRRREEKKMLWCLGEIYLFHTLARTKQQKQCARGIITNVINRLIIMMDEEMLFTEWYKYLICKSLLAKFEKSKRNDFISLVKVCKILLASEMLRLNDDIRAYFDRGMRCLGVKKPKKIYKSIENTGTLNSFGFMISEDPILKKVYVCKKTGDEEDALVDMANFIYYFERKDPNCFYWVFELYSKGSKGKKGARRFRRRSCEYIIWEYLFQKCGDNEYLNKYVQYKLEEYFVKNRGERAIWLTASVMAVMRQDSIHWAKEKMTYDISVDSGDIIEIFKNREKLEIDDYAIDMHCSKGRQMGKNKTDFIKEGSLVVGENKEYFVKEWRDVYNTCR